MGIIEKGEIQEIKKKPFKISVVQTLSVGCMKSVIMKIFTSFS